MNNDKMSKRSHRVYRTYAKVIIPTLGKLFAASHSHRQFKVLVAFLCTCFAASASAKLGETVPQLIKRFGRSYTVEPIRIGKKYKFRSENVSVDAVVANNISVGETYFSDHPLNANGEPPNDIVRAVLRTNVARVKWIEIEAARYQADYALRSSDSAYIALLTYSGPQPEDVVWTITVARRENLSYLLPATGSEPADPLPPDKSSKSISSSSDLTPEEQALLNKGAFMEMYKPDEHSRHFITHIDAVGDSKTGKPRKIENPQSVLCFVFGMEDAEPAREEGRSMAVCHYTRSQAEQFLFAQGWDKYHDRFFTRCYVQEGEDAYDKEVAAQAEPRQKRSL